MSETEPSPTNAQPERLIRNHLHELDTPRLPLDFILTLLEQKNMIDIFLHARFKDMRDRIVEFRTAWRHLQQGGLLAADDIFWRDAFHEFCRRIDRPYVQTHRLGVCRK